MIGKRVQVSAGGWNVEGTVVHILPAGQIFTLEELVKYKGDPRNKPVKLSRYVILKEDGSYAIVPKYSKIKFKVLLDGHWVQKS